MDNDKIIMALVIILAIVAVGGFLLLNQPSHTVNNVAPAANNTSSSVNVEKITSEDSVSSNQQKQSDSSNKQKQIDYNSPDSEYYKWETDGSYHKKEPGEKYIYSQDAVTGEWSYWADKS